MHETGNFNIQVYEVIKNYELIMFKNSVSFCSPVTIIMFLKVLGIFSKIIKFLEKTQ
jgi:hypothetical protein